jgi:hypothetical protein
MIRPPTAGGRPAGGGRRNLVSHQAMDATASREARPPSVVERTHYYAKPGRAADVLRTRRRASEIRRRLGLPAGRIFVKAAPHDEGPDVLWECAFADPAAHAQDLDARARSEEFAGVRREMTALIDRFERLVLVPDADTEPGPALAALR